jgi:hypothetical protein
MIRTMKPQQLQQPPAPGYDSVRGARAGQGALQGSDAGAAGDARSGLTPSAASTASQGFAAKPGAWVELGLTLPIFLIYHLGVVFLGIQNATDFLTHGMLYVADGNTSRYLAITCALGVVFIGVFWFLGRGQTFSVAKFVQVAVEGAIYAYIMSFAGSYLVGKVFGGVLNQESKLTGFIMSLGAGFYEEITFRVLLFGLGAKFLVWFWTGKKLRLVGSNHGFALSLKIVSLAMFWAIFAAFVFSGIHYVGAISDAFAFKSFFFRAILGLALTLIYATRGFAAAVWTHALYDVWVLTLG